MKPVLLPLAAVVGLLGCSSPAEDTPGNPGGEPVAAALELPVGHPDRTATELEIARREFEKNPTDELAAIWFGRRLAYVGRIEEAIEVYTQAFRQHPRSARLLRHRGHRFLSQRQFELAEDDLRHAARLCEGRPDEVEPDGMPNARGRPRSTTQGNIWYHLALAHFLQGEFESAAQAWRSALDLCTNDDTLVAVSHWYFMTLRRLGQEMTATALLGAITEDMEILENGSYHQVLLLKKDQRHIGEVLGGETQLQRETLGYGVAHWLLMNGETERSREMLKSLTTGPSSNAFGRIAAEVELARLPPAASR